MLYKTAFVKTLKFHSQMGSKSMLQHKDCSHHWWSIKLSVIKLYTDWPYWTSVQAAQEWSSCLCLHSSCVSFFFFCSCKIWLYLHQLVQSLFSFTKIKAINFYHGHFIISDFVFKSHSEYSLWTAHQCTQVSSFTSYNNLKKSKAWGGTCFYIVWVTSIHTSWISAFYAVMS